MNTEPESGVQHRRKFVRYAAATLMTSVVTVLTSGKSKAAGRHSDPYYCLCLLKGTRIATDSAEVRVEDLRSGDLVRTLSGRLRPILSIHVEHFSKEPDAKWSRHHQPVLLTRSSLADNVPHRDLYVSPKHGVLLDGYLIQAECLVNDVTIRQDEFPEDSIEYYHIELEDHDVLIAEGAPVESMLTLSETAIEAFKAAHGTVPSEREPCAPILGYDGGRSAAMGLIRYSASAFIDVRDPIQITYDRLAERALAIASQRTGVSA